MKDKAKYHSAQQSEEIFSDQQQNSINIRINPKLIATAVSEGYLTQLAFYYFLRYHYKYSNISNKRGNPKRRIAQLSGLSQPTIDKYFRILIQRDLLKRTVHGYQLAATAPRHKRFKIAVSPAPTVSEIKQLLSCQVIRDCGQQQLLVRQLKNFCLPIEKQDNQLSGTSTPNASWSPYLSVRYLATKLNISCNTVRKLIRNLNERCVIRTVSSYSELIMENVTPDVVNHLFGYHGHRYYMNGCLWQVHASRHTFLHQPITAKPMTVKRYFAMQKDNRLRQLVNNERRTLIA
mgnify:CR=1 FL=1